MALLRLGLKPWRPCCFRGGLWEEDEDEVVVLGGELLVGRERVCVRYRRFLCMLFRLVVFLTPGGFEALRHEPSVLGWWCGWGTRSRQSGRK